ncbi:MAG: ABC transporter ATP-binding protein [Lewinellaceae bacterium]|nr:ABC transporter ATP-binding protein [Lewinellaceae bacterium]
MESGKFDLHLLGRVLALAKPHRRPFITSGILAVLLAPLATSRPLLIQQMVDHYILIPDPSGLLTMTLVILAVLVIEVLMRYVFIYTTNFLGQSVIKDLRVRVFQHITHLKLTYFDKTPIGTSTTRTINDIQTINDVFSQGTITILADLLTVVTVLIIMLITSWKLTVICMLTMPFLIVASYLFKEKVKAAFQKVRNQLQKMNSFLQEHITGMRIVQIFTAEDRERQKFRTINRAYTQANLDSITAYAVFFPVVEIISATSLALMIWWGAHSAISGEVSLGALIAFPLYLSMLFRPIRMLADKFNTLQMGLVAADRVFGVLDNHEFIQNNGTWTPERLKGEITFEHVSFSYDDVHPVLRDLSFQVETGQTLAIVGSTGSGKSTIINILNRFYDIQKGDILVDGRSIRDYELFALRRRIAIVLQDVFLFSGTVLENITLKDPRISREEVETSARMIGAHEFIMRLPGGYDFQVQERGATLSMGQRQLISFVRALVFDPDILILDEATSSIDTETEQVIQHAIETMIATRTSIVIAHRLSTIRHADRIMVLESGQRLEFGTHDELMANAQGRYRELVEMQFSLIE